MPQAESKEPEFDKAHTISIRVGDLEWASIEKALVQSQKKFYGDFPKSTWLTRILRFYQWNQLSVLDNFRPGLLEKIDVAVLTQLYTSLASFTPTLIENSLRMHPENLNAVKKFISNFQNAADKIQRESAPTAKAG